MPDSNHVPKVFVSYSWEDNKHKAWVADLCQRLRRDGVDVTLDKWHAVPGDRLPLFMERAVRENQFVLVVCTPMYKQKADGRQGGVGYEGDVITGEVMNRRIERKFIPILRRGEWREAAPSWIAGVNYIDLSDRSRVEDGYGSLLRVLHGELELAPPIGPRPNFAERVADGAEPRTPILGAPRHRIPVGWVVFLSCAVVAASGLYVYHRTDWQRALSSDRIKPAQLAATPTAASAPERPAQPNAVQAESQPKIPIHRSSKSPGAAGVFGNVHIAAFEKASASDLFDAKAAPAEIAFLATPGVKAKALIQRDTRTIAAAAAFQNGRVIALGHPAPLSNETDRAKTLLRHMLAWLHGSGMPGLVGLSSAHCDRIVGNVAFRGNLAQMGYQVRVLSGPIDASELAGVRVLVIDGPPGSFKGNELAAVKEFVAGGGGLLAVGMPWVWKSFYDREDQKCEGNIGQNIADLTTYPMNKLVKPFGLQWLYEFAAPSQ